MVGNPLIVKMIESTINKSIREITTSPEKGLRNLVALASSFANSPIQKDLVITLEAALKNPNSPYHKIIPDLINNTNPHTLRSFIINISHNSLSHGGRKIKQYKKAYNFKIPWTITLDFTGQTTTKLDKDSILNIIDQGQKIGIYTYLIFTNTLDDFLTIPKQNPDSAFIIYVPPTSLTPAKIQTLNSSHNTFFSVHYQPDIDPQAFNTTTKLLGTNQCLFGTHTYYTNENTNDILNNKLITQLPTKINSPIHFLIQSPTSTPQNASLIRTYTHQAKLNQNHPIFLIDLYEDIATVNDQLSNSSCMLKILSNGNVVFDLANTPTQFNITTTKLLKIISKQA